MAQALPDHDVSKLRGDDRLTRDFPDSLSNWLKTVAQSDVVGDLVIDVRFWLLADIKRSDPGSQESAKFLFKESMPAMLRALARDF